MTDPTAQEKMNSRLSSVRMKMDTLQSSVRLADIRDQIEDIDTLISGFSSRIKELRDRGYVYGKNMPGKAATMATQWRPIRTSALLEIDRQTPRLEQQLRPFESQVAQVQSRASNPGSIEATVTRLEKELEALESKVNSIENSTRGMYDSFSDQADEFEQELDRIEWMLQQFSEATFQLLPSEGAVMAVEAVFSRDEKVGKDDLEGILYLTDQRLLFEQKQEIATKKFLFIATEKEKVHKLIFESPVELVDKATASKKGLFGNQDHLELSFKSGVSLQRAWFHLKGQDCNWWQGLIGQARTGDFDDERAVAIDKEQVRKASAAPSKCPSCGAPITQVVLRGMDTIQCEYCQYVIRL